MEFIALSGRRMGKYKGRVPDMECIHNVEYSWIGKIKYVNIGRKVDLREIGIDGANWIRLAQDRVQWRAFMKTVMNLRVP
jgi:hypothetical protein